MSLPRICNLLTIWVNLICMEEMDSPSSMWKSSYCWTRVLIIDFLTLFIPSWRVSNASHIALEVLQWETKWYSFTQREEIRMFRPFKSNWTFLLSSSLQPTLILSIVTPSETTCGFNPLLTTTSQNSCQPIGYERSCTLSNIHSFCCRK